MKTLYLENGVLHLSAQRNDQCPFLQSGGVYASQEMLPEWILARTGMTLAEFYQGECSSLPAEAYSLSPAHQEIIKRFPHTNSTLQVDDQQQYRITEVAVCVSTRDLLEAVQAEDDYPVFFQRLEGFQSLRLINDSQLLSDYAYKRKRLLLKGEYGGRELLHSAHQQNVKSMHEQLFISRQLYYFAHYCYAAVIDFYPHYGIDSYEKFHQAYGKFIYSVTISKGGVTVPLLWPDYLYHQPEYHLEFGIPGAGDNPRFQLMQHWNEGEEISITVLAEGFQDVVLTTKLKKQHQPAPQLSEKKYSAAMPMKIVLEPDLLQEIKHHREIATVTTPDKNKTTLADIDFSLTDRMLSIPLAQFSQEGTFQLAINSSRFGEMLFFFSYQKEVAA